MPLPLMVVSHYRWISITGNNYGYVAMNSGNCCKHYTSNNQLLVVTQNADYSLVGKMVTVLT